MPYITTRDNTRLYVKDWGSGRPVILTHGWPLSADTWDEAAMAIANAGFRAIAYDRRGFGRSDQPLDGYNYDTLADDLAAVIAETGATDATIVGFSMGGGEVARYMSRHGGRNVAQAALIASVVPYMLQTPDNPNGVPQATYDQIMAGLKEDRAKFFTGFFRDFYGVGLVSHPVSNEVIEWSRNVAMKAGVPGTLGCAQAFSTTDFRPDLAAFNVPTLIVHGTDDSIVPIATSARQAAAALPNATVIEYEGAPHGLFATHKERLT
ncbi:MAG: alpha/beta hydrolase, partial [Chloroflexi bacterium]